MAAEGKLLVISAILRFEDTKPFRLGHITQITGMTRQAVYHHLVKFEQQELLVKKGHNYFINSRDALFEENDEGIKRRRDASLLDINATFRQPELVNDMTMLMRSYFALQEHYEKEAPELAKKLSPALEAQRVEFRTHTEAAIKNYQSYKKYLATRMKDYHQKSARKFLMNLSDEAVTKLFQTYCEDLHLTKAEADFLRSTAQEFIYGKKEDK